jgi:hypothetical protein
MTRALVFACPRDIGANSLRLGFREGTSAETSDAPITHSRNVPLYRYRAVERKAYRLVTQGNRVNKQEARFRTEVPELQATKGH